MKKYLYIEADWNDADYVHSLTEITDEDLCRLFPLFIAIKNFKPDENNRHNYPTYTFRDNEKDIYELYGDIVGEEILEEFNEDFLPPSGDETCSIHSISSITVFEVSNEQKII